MANLTCLDEPDLWSSSTDFSELDSIGVTEECLMQNVKDKPNYILLGNVDTELQSFDDFIFDKIVDGSANNWNSQDVMVDQTSLIAQSCEEVNDYNLLSQQSENILFDWGVVQCDTIQPPENSTSGSHLQVPSAALPINIQQQANSTVNSDVGSFEEYEVISSNVIKLDGHAAGSHNSCQVPNTHAASGSGVNPVEAGKKMPRRRRNHCPKEKLYMRIEPFSDEEEERKRQNAVKAHKNRQKRSTEISILKGENEELRMRLQEKDRLLQEKDKLIKAFHEAQKLKNKALANIKFEISKLIMT